MHRLSSQRTFTSAASRRAALTSSLGLAAGLLLLLAPGGLTAAEEKPKPPAKPAAAPAKGPAKPAAPSAAKVTGEPKEAPLSFTDDDLEKYRKPRPEPAEDDQEEEEAADEPADAAPGGPAIPPAPTAAKPAPARPVVKPAPRPNPVLGPPPTEDPLKKWKQQDALSAMRKQQIDTLRERIAGLRSRLDYLKTKKDGLLNPGPPQVAGTKGNTYPPTQPPDPNKPPPPPNYKPDISPGRPIQPVGLIFPSLPEPQTDQDRENDKSMKIADLLENVKKEIETVTDDLKRANDDLITIETRAAGENATP